jgi:hypothetical protein
MFYTSLDGNIPCPKCGRRLKKIWYQSSGEKAKEGHGCLICDYEVFDNDIKKNGK